MRSTGEGAEGGLDLTDNMGQLLLGDGSHLHGAVRFWKRSRRHPRWRAEEMRR